MKSYLFDEKEYTRRLIAGGIDPVSAADVASKTACSHNLSSQDQRRALKPAALIQLPASAPTSALKSSTRHTVASQAKVASGPLLAIPRKLRAAAPKVKSTSAVAELVNEVYPLEWEETLKDAKAKIKKQQLSLFELAPWADSLRAMPNDLARSALFTVRNKSIPRVVRQSHSIFVLSRGVEITYTGIELRAGDDELVWLQVLEYAKHTPAGTPITFTFYRLCKDLGWAINGRYYAKAEECLTRLQATALQFISDRIGQLDSISLIHRFRVLGRGTKDSRCQVAMDDDMVMLFAGKYYSKFEWEKYRSLSPTARRMFDYFVSHSEPFPMLLESFRLLCGSDSERPRKWTEQTNKACEELTRSGLVKKAWVTAGRVSCDR